MDSNQNNSDTSNTFNTDISSATDRVQKNKQIAEKFALAWSRGEDTSEFFAQPPTGMGGTSQQFSQKYEGNAPLQIRHSIAEGDDVVLYTRTPDNKLQLMTLSFADGAIDEIEIYGQLQA
ncbi:MAG TPA: hypothetical protein VK338_00620 [Candidatus Nitrosocosmicus sp.]|nr:hypothetical protein [Candidatus Nitrosocosmicus sp.]